MDVILLQISIVRSKNNLVKDNESELKTTVSNHKDI